MEKKFKSIDWYMRLILIFWFLYLFFFIFKIITIFFAKTIYLKYYYLCKNKINILIILVFLIFFVSIKNFFKNLNK